MQRKVHRSAAGAGGSSSANSSGLPLTTSDASNLRRRKRKIKRTVRRRKQFAIRVACGAGFGGVMLLLLGLVGRGPFGGRIIRKQDAESSPSSSAISNDRRKFSPLRSPLFDFGDALDNSNALAQCDDRESLQKLNREMADKSLAIGAHFLMQHQRSAGNFDYEYDWTTKANSSEDSAVRQSGALWGLSLIFLDMMSSRDALGGSYSSGSAHDVVLKDIAARIKKGISFFHKQSRVLNRPITDDDNASALEGINKMRYVTYPDGKDGNASDRQDQGTQALFVLSLIDFLRGLGCEEDAAVAGITAEEMNSYREMLDEFLPFLVTQHTSLSRDRFQAWDSLMKAGDTAVNSGLWYGEKPRGTELSADLQMEKWWDDNSSAVGGFYGNYDLLGERKGQSSPYYDGESTLAMIKAAKYLGPAYTGIWPLAASTARNLHLTNVVQALRKNKDSSVTKGCYQWLSMSLFELSTVTFGTGRKHRFDLPAALQTIYRGDEFGSWLVEMSLWMVDVHKTLSRSKNTGYAYEGIIHAWAWGSYYLSKRDGKISAGTLKKLHCTIHEGLSKIISWQVGSGAENNHLNSWDHQSGLGGVQNAADEPGLRIDVTQHQMHSTILSRRYIFKDESKPWPWQQVHAAAKKAAAA